MKNSLESPEPENNSNADPSDTKHIWVASREDFEALIPEDPDDWTEEMWDYCYQQEQEDMRNFAEQQKQLDGKF